MAQVTTMLVIDPVIAQKVSSAQQWLKDYRRRFPTKGSTTTVPLAPPFGLSSPLLSLDVNKQNGPGKSTQRQQHDDSTTISAVPTPASAAQATGSKVTNSKFELGDFVRGSKDTQSPLLPGNLELREDHMRLDSTAMRTNFDVQSSSEPRDDTHPKTEPRTPAGSPVRAIQEDTPYSTLEEDSPCSNRRAISPDCVDWRDESTQFPTEPDDPLDSAFEDYYRSIALSGESSDTCIRADETPDESAPEQVETLEAMTQSQRSLDELGKSILAMHHIYEEMDMHMTSSLGDLVEEEAASSCAPLLADLMGSDFAGSDLMDDTPKSITKTYDPLDVAFEKFYAEMAMEQKGSPPEEQTRAPLEWRMEAVAEMKAAELTKALEQKAARTAIEGNKAEAAKAAEAVLEEEGDPADAEATVSGDDAAWRLEADLRLEAEDEAARRIQAAVTGHWNRTSLKLFKQCVDRRLFRQDLDTQEEGNTIVAAENELLRRIADGRLFITPDAVTPYAMYAKEAEINLMAEDVAANRIQAALRGHWARISVELFKCCVEGRLLRYGLHAKEADLLLVAEDEAAQRIQAAIAGHWARTSLALFVRCTDAVGRFSSYGLNSKEADWNVVVEAEAARRIQTAIAGRWACLLVKLVKRCLEERTFEYGLSSKDTNVLSAPGTDAAGYRWYNSLPLM